MFFETNLGGGGGSAEVQLVGTYSGNQNIDVSEFLRPTDTVDNFIVEIYSSASKSTANKSVQNVSAHNLSGTIGAFTVTKTLTGSTLAIGGMTRSFSAKWVETVSASAPHNYRVWHY